jgi:hypothetical protein
MKAFGLCVLISAGVICFALADPDRQLAPSQPFSEGPSPGGRGGSVDEFDKARMEERARLQATILKNIGKNPIQGEKEKLYSLVSHGKRMDRLFTVTFQTTVGRISREQLENIKSRSGQAEVQGLLKDPDGSLIVVGFADEIGPDDMGHDVSRIRAESVATVLRSECDVRQTIYTVPTGSRISPDPLNYGKARTAEIWWAKP